MRAAVRSLVLLTACLSVAPALARTGSTTLIAAHERKPAPDFSLADARGARVSLAAQKGRVVLLDFWATWCTGCKVEIPWYIEFQKKYAPQGLVPIGAAMDDEGWAQVRPYIKEHPFNYPIVAGDAAALVKKFNITGLPLTVLIDRNGRIADAHAGVVDKDAWEQEVRALLKERPR